MVLSSSYREIHDLLKSVNYHAVAVSMRIKALKTKVISALMRGVMCHAILLDGELSEDVHKFKFCGSIFVANAQGTRSEAG